MGLGGTLLAAKCRSEIDYGDAGSAKLHMLVGIVGDIGDSSEVLTDELAQDAVAAACVRQEQRTILKRHIEACVVAFRHHGIARAEHRKFSHENISHPLSHLSHLTTI